MLFSVDNFSELMCTVDLAVEIKLRFQISFSSVAWTGPNTESAQVSFCCSRESNSLFNFAAVR